MAPYWRPSGECRFNYLYWNFLLENRERLRGNPRLAMPYRNLEKMGADRQAAITAEASTFLDGLASDGRARAKPEQGVLDL